MSLNRVCQSDLIEVVYAFRPVSVGACNNGSEIITVDGYVAVGKGKLGPLVPSLRIGIEVVREANQMIAHLSSSVYIYYVGGVYGSENGQRLQAFAHLNERVSPEVQ